jgi:hypothetical protein
MAAILGNSMTKPLGHDEQMYCAGGVLLAEGKMIYRDFSYIGQMPYHALLYAALFKVLNTTQYLLAGRILSAVCDILVAICIVGIYMRVFKAFPISGMLLGLASVVLYVFNPVVDYSNGFAWNHDVVILCVVSAFWVFQTIDFERKSKYWRIAVIGALLTLASCMRITTAIVQVLFLAVLLVQPAESMRQRIKTVFPFLIAMALVLIWPLWMLVVAPRAFFLNMFWIPVLNGEWQRQINMVHNKFYRLVNYLTTPSYILLIVIALHFYLVAVWNRRKLKMSDITDVLLAGLLALMFFIIAFIPPTMLRQYIAMPVPFLVISLAYPLLYLRKLAGSRTELNTQFNVNCIAMAACVAVTVASGPVVLRRIPRLFDRQSWTPIRLHRISEDIAEKTKNSRPILTLAPLYALEGGCDIYTELSAGPFVYRVADFMKPSDVEATHTVGPKTLRQLVEKSPPAAVILNVEPKFLEEPLFQTAVKADWRVEAYGNGPVVYFER